MGDHVAPAGMTAATPTEERISTLLADRPCSACTFNLVGQSIIRERHYGMLVVRCPECGAIASLQEYPLLGRWAGRWAAVAAGLWLLVAVAVSLGIAGVICGFLVGTMETTTQPLQTLIAKQYEAYQVAQGAPQNQVSGWWNIEPAWWSGLDKQALIRDAGGWRNAIQWWGLLIWVPGFVILFSLASVWAVGAAHRRGIRLLLTYLPMLALGGVFFVLASLPGGRWLTASDLAIELSRSRVLPIAAVLLVLPVVLGAFAGRSLARALVVLWLPPRLRVPLSFLWICDGKTPPKPTW